MFKRLSLSLSYFLPHKLLLICTHRFSLFHTQSDSHLERRRRDAWKEGKEVSRENGEHEEEEESEFQTHWNGFHRIRGFHTQHPWISYTESLPGATNKGYRMHVRVNGERQRSWQHLR
eukprot:c30820_g1_i1 orf=421-774(-)